MNDEDFEALNEINIRLLTEVFEKKLPHDKAAEQAAAEQNELLPDGAATAGQHLFSIKSDGHTSGGLWFTCLNREGNDFAFLFFIHIRNELRRKGIGSSAMKLLENEVNKLGLPAIRLHVLKDNTSAMNLYAKLGYKLFTAYSGYDENDPGVVMEKKL